MARLPHITKTHPHHKTLHGTPHTLHPTHTTQTIDTALNQQDDAISNLSDVKQSADSIIPETLNQESIVEDSIGDTNSQFSQVKRSSKKTRSNGNGTSNDNSVNNKDSRMTLILNPTPLQSLPKMQTLPTLS